MLKIFYRIIFLFLFMVFFSACPVVIPPNDTIDLDKIMSQRGEDDVVSYAIWAQISANDPNGIIITGVEEGDEIFISSITSYCSFDHSVLQPFTSLAAFANALTGNFKAVLNSRTSSVFNGDFEAATLLMRQAFDNEVDNGKDRRDGYGKDPGSGVYAANEGGIIVCMPQAFGPIYASDDNHLNNDCHKNGRLETYYRGSVASTNSFFPCNLNNSYAVMSRQANKSGQIQILAFDSKFSDNTGYYEIRFAIVRNQNKLPAGKQASDYIIAMENDGFL